MEAPIYSNLSSVADEDLPLPPPPPSSYSPPNHQVFPDPPEELLKQTDDETKNDAYSSSRYVGFRPQSSSVSDV